MISLDFLPNCKVTLFDPTGNPWNIRRELTFTYESWRTNDQVAALINPTTRLILLVDHCPIVTESDMDAIRKEEATYESIGEVQRVWEDLDLYIDEFGELVYVRVFLDLKGESRDIDLRYNPLPDNLKHLYELSDRNSTLLTQIPRKHIRTVPIMDTKTKTVRV